MLNFCNAVKSCGLGMEVHCVKLLTGFAAKCFGLRHVIRLTAETGTRLNGTWRQECRSAWNDLAVNVVGSANKTVMIFAVQIDPCPDAVVAAAQSK